MDKKTIHEAISKVREGAAKRKFVQSIDFVINLKNVTANAVKPDSVFLPKGRGKPVKVVVIAEGETALQAKNEGADLVINKNELSNYGTKDAKKLATEYEWFIPQMHLMQQFARYFGPSLGSRGKMPLPKDILPPTGGNPKRVMDRLRSSVRIKIKKDPIIHTLIGTEEMSDDDLSENAWVIYDNLMHTLPQGVHNIGRMVVKTTMGKSVIVGAAAGKDKKG